MQPEWVKWASFDSFVGWIVSSQKICWSSIFSNVYVQMWPYLELRLCRGNKVRMWTLMHCDCCPHKRGKFGHRMDLWRGHVMWRHEEKPPYDWSDASTCQGVSRMTRKHQQLEHPGRSLPSLHQRGYDPTTSRPQTSSLQSDDTMHFCNFKRPSCWYFVIAALGNQYRCYCREDQVQAEGSLDSMEVTVKQRNCS